MKEKEELKASIGLKIICFLIPLVGLIIYACNVAHNRKYANQCGLSSLIGFIIPIIIVIVAFIFFSIACITKNTLDNTFDASKNNLITMSNVQEYSVEETIIPKVAGMTFEEAKEKLEKMNLKVEKIEEKNKYIEYGYVIRQEPEDNTITEEGTTIKLYVSIEK